MSGSIPKPSYQLDFLAKLQRLLEEGQFTATYKYALLIALVEVAVERGEDTDARLVVPLEALAEKFADLYWAHTRPFRGGVLSQNKGENIAVLRILAEAQAASTSIAAARRNAVWKATTRKIARQIEAMPLFKLQTVRNGQNLVFLYEHVVRDSAVTLLPGVAYCLRRFSGLVRTLAQTAWVTEVRANTRNAYYVGETESLERFLFGQDRLPLARVGEILADLQDGECFYCAGTIRLDLHVDHFIPWALYPSNLAHNFVGAHADCNSDKSDLLPAIPHLQAWLSRNQTLGTSTLKAFEDAGLLYDRISSESIARWAYQRAKSVGASLWLGRGQTLAIAHGGLLPL